MFYAFTIKGTLPGLNEYLKAERDVYKRQEEEVPNPMGGAAE